jgi:tRNA pseudouridine38-40 synthase
VDEGCSNSPVPRYKLTIAYDGTDFCGWQRQEPLAPALPGTPDAIDPRPPDQRPARAPGVSISPKKIIEDLGGGRVALRTVQHVLDKALGEILNERVVTLGASRTDAGVHARGQIVAFTCEPRDAGGRPAGAGGPAPANEAMAGHSGWPPERGLDRLVRAINGRLPEDVVVIGAEAVPYGWDPVGGATSKGYSYTFHTSRTRPLFDRFYVHEVWDSLDERAMHEAGQILVGEHDFAAFTAVNHGRLTTVRTIHACSVARLNAERVRIDVSGGGFLYNMVRIIAGTLFEVGRGAWTLDRVREALASKDRQKAGPTLPGRGLCLEWVRYR